MVKQRECDRKKCPCTTHAGRERIAYLVDKSPADFIPAVAGEVTLYPESKWTPVQHVGPNYNDYC